MKISLNDGWKLRCYEEGSSHTKILQPDIEDGEWLDVEVPGDVHTTLLRHGIIEDPFYSTNVEKCRWIEGKIWWYRKTFIFDKPELEHGFFELKFNGLDTFATIFLNGEELGTHDNMFTPALFDVTQKLKPGVNHLAVKFDSAISVTAQKDYSRMWYSYNPNRVWVRKAQMNFRWDWGPRIITVGIWKDVELNIFDTAKIDNVLIRTVKIEKSSAEILVAIETKVFEDSGDLDGVVCLNGGEKRLSEKVRIENGRGLLTLKVERPRLWWTHDLGEPFLYDLDVTLRKGEVTLDSYSTKVGIRDIEVKQKGAGGEGRFTFVLNGVELFAKGANWIPASSFIGAIKDESYLKLIAMAKECRMNMLRVWGGGIYEKELFYQECDRQGILVWQDFMFACSSYPDFDSEFMENVESEIIHVVKSLRNHPSLAIWCGNNEIQWIHGQKMPDLEDLRLYGEKIFHDLMPRILAELDPSRLYWPSSPFGGNDPNSDQLGDKHNWQVWAGQVYPHRQGERLNADNTPSGISFRKYAEDQGKFISEFGIQAAPVLETLQSCIPEKELFLGSFELRYRNKDKRPNRGVMLMESYTGLPADLAEYIDYSMIAQAEGLKFGIEHFRRRKPNCSGTLIWQLNDCWPAISWSLVDFYFRPKAAYYYVKRAYHPVLLSFKEEGPDLVSLWITNDTLDDFRDRIEVGLADFFGNIEYQEIIDIFAPANTVVKIKEFSKNRINVTYTNFEFLYVNPGNKEVDSNILFFESFKDLNLPHCRLEVDCATVAENALSVKVKTDYFAKYVKICCSLDKISLSDNYFDLRPGEEKTVLVTSLNGNTLTQKDIVVSAINQLA